MADKKEKIEVFASPEARKLELIKKFNMSVVEQNGVEGIKIPSKKPSASEIEYIKENKKAFISLLKNIEAEKKAASIKRQKEAAEKAAVEKARKQNIITSGEAKLAIVYSGWYLMEERILYVHETKEGEFEVLEEVFSDKNIRKVVQELNIELSYSGSLSYGESNVYIITEDQSQQVKKHIMQKLNEKAAAKKAAKVKKEAERQAKFDEAKNINKPVVLDSWNEDCNDPHEECDLDNVTEYAMPDGSIKQTRNHTW